MSRATIGLLKSQPVFAPNLTPAYANLPFTLLAFAVETNTGKNFSQLLHKEILQPLGMMNTGISPGDSSRAVIPPGNGSWGSDFGINAPWV